MSCRKAMSEERKRYCFVLDRTNVVGKSSMDFFEHNSQILREKVPAWFSHVKRKGDPDSQFNGSIMNDEMGKFGTSDRVKLRAKFAHTAVEPSQLSFIEGDLINPVSEVVSGWQYGENVKTMKLGWFPAAYTEQVLAVATGPTVSQTLPAGAVHPRPPLETSSSHKSLKRHSTTGPDMLNLPPPDYVNLDNKDNQWQTSLTATLEPSGRQPSSLVSTTAAVSPGLNTNSMSPLAPPPPPLPPPPAVLAEEKEKADKDNTASDTESNGAVNNSSSDVSHL